MDILEQVTRAVAAARAREHGRPDRLFADPLAAALAGPEGVAFLAEMERLHPGDPSGPNPLAVRARFFDDFIAEATGDPTLRQAVLFAAGMDTRAYRLAWPDGMDVYEIDEPALLSAKQSVCDAAGAQPTCRRVPVAASPTGAWEPALRAAGFDPDRPSLWLLEGVLLYRSEPEVNQLLHAIAGLVAPGSRLGLDVIGRETLGMPPLRPALDYFAAHGAPWRFGHDRPEELLRSYGLASMATQLGDAAYNYRRSPVPMPPRETPGVPCELAVVARRRRATSS